MGPALTVVGSINLDLVAKAERLPRPGETITGATFAQTPGGKGANQAVAAARLGATVTMIGAVGGDALAEPALAGLREAGVAEAWVTREGPTGVALIVVDANGDNTITVAPGANHELRPGDFTLPDDPVLCQLEVTDGLVDWVADNVSSDFFLNAAPARANAPAADVTIVNEYEYEALTHRDGLVCVTCGERGAVLLEGGAEVARATPPQVDSIDGTGAGDAFTACFVVSLLEGREREEALRRACVAGALATTKMGAQTSLPTKEEVDSLL